MCIYASISSLILTFPNNSHFFHISSFLLCGSLVWILVSVLSGHLNRTGLYQAQLPENPLSSDIQTVATLASVKDSSSCDSVITQLKCTSAAE